jgi:hypothetical protein
VVVHGYNTDGPDANFTLSSWNVGTTSAGNMIITTPATAVIGGTGQIGLTFTGLASATLYPGTVAHHNSVVLPVTIVSVTTP